VSGVHEGLAQVMAGLSHIPKQRSQGVSYEFRSIDAVFNVVHGLMSDNGMWFKPVVLDDWQLNMIPGSKDRVQAQALFRLEVFACHKDGSEASIGVGLAQSHDYGDKAVYQAQQNAMKYVVIEAFAIPTAESDMDAREADPIPSLSEEEISKKLQNRLKTKAAELTQGDVDAAKALYEKFLPENLTPENVETTEKAMEASIGEAA
jgi:hypothetical protein